MYEIHDQGNGTAVITWDGRPIAAIACEGKHPWRRSIRHNVRSVEVSPTIEDRVNGVPEPDEWHAVGGSSDLHFRTLPTVAEVAEAAVR